MVEPAWSRNNKFAIEGLRRAAEKLEALHTAIEENEGDEKTKELASEFATNVTAFIRRTTATATELTNIFNRPAALNLHSEFLCEDIRMALARNQRRQMPGERIERDYNSRKKRPA